MGHPVYAQIRFSVASSASGKFFASLAATAGIRGAQVLLGPVNVLNQGIRMIAVPEAARALKHSYRRLWLVGLAISLGVGAGALAWGAVFLLLPEVVGEQLLGPGVWAQARTVMVPVILLQAFGVGQDFFQHEIERSVARAGADRH